MKSEQSQNNCLRVNFFNLLKFSLVSGVVTYLLIIPAIAADEEIIKVTISPAVQEQILKASPEERKELEEAINHGNMFIPQHLDGTAYDVPEDGDKQVYKKWLQKTRPLINKDMKDWYTDSTVQSNSILTMEINGQKAYLVALCHQVELVSINVADENFDVGWKAPNMDFKGDRFVLKYRAKIAGMWVAPDYFDDFLPDKNDDFEEVLISLDKDNKVSQVFPQYDASAWISKRVINILNRDIKHPVVLPGQTKAGVYARNVRSKKLIQKVYAEEAKVCKSTQDYSNQSIN
jgi:hypothetical protein